MHEFIKTVADDIKYKDANYTKEDFYYILKYIGVKKDNSIYQDIEKFYQEFLGNLNNSLVKYESRKVKSEDKATYYIGFNVDKKANYEEAVKVYFPVKYEYQISALKTVFLYLIRNNIRAVVKFYVKSTCENIVIRFYDKEDVIPFIKYCNSNFVLEDLLVKLNPFIAGMNGIGIVKDDNTKLTYNQTLSMLLEEYFYMLKSSDNLDLASDKDFADFVLKRMNIEDDAIIKFDIKSVLANITMIIDDKASEKSLI